MSEQVGVVDVIDVVDVADLIVPSDGEGYKTLGAAKMAMGKRGYAKDDFEVLPFAKGGFGVKLKPGVSLPSVNDDNAPFSAGVPDDDEDDSGAPLVKPYVESYRRVRFHPKSSEHQMDQVELSVNGETLVMEREKEVVIPYRFVECARHATYPMFKQLPNQPRKHTGAIMLFPFDDLGAGTESEYRKKKAEGTKINREEAEKSGLL